MYTMRASSGATRPLENCTSRREVGRNLDSVVLRDVVEVRLKGEPGVEPESLSSLWPSLNCLAKGWGYGKKQGTDEDTCIRA